MTELDSSDGMKPRLSQFRFGSFNVTSQVCGRQSHDEISLERTESNLRPELNIRQ